MKKNIFKLFLLILISFCLSSTLMGKPQKGETKSNNDSSTKETTQKTKDKSPSNYKAIKTGLKSEIRNIFENMNKNLPKEDFGKLPEGLSIIEGEGFRGIKILHGLLEFRAYTWADDSGLLDNYQKCREAGDQVVAAINGTFYSERGILGQVIQDGQIPYVRQIPGRLSRCFVCAYRGAKNAQFWYLGETPLSSNELMRPHSKDMVWYNGAANTDIIVDNLIGGGGWILKNRKDAHWEAIERQFFRFRSEDQTSRKTVVAQDTQRNLYFLVFEAGFSLHQVARAFVKNDVFKDVTDAIFLDGGSSSCIVLNGKYLVAPLYLVDKARFSCIQIIKPTLIW